jgi:hypothetical protein
VGVAQRLCGGPVHQHEAVGRILAGRQRVAGQPFDPERGGEVFVGADDRHGPVFAAAAGGLY